MIENWKLEQMHLHGSPVTSSESKSSAYGTYLLSPYYTVLCMEKIWESYELDSYKKCDVTFFTLGKDSCFSNTVLKNRMVSNEETRLNQIFNQKRLVENLPVNKNIIWINGCIRGRFNMAKRKVLYLG